MNHDELEAPVLPADRDTLPELSTPQRFDMIDATLRGISAETAGLSKALHDIKNYLAGQSDLGETLRAATAAILAKHEEQRQTTLRLEKLEAARHLAELNGDSE